MRSTRPNYEPAPNAVLNPRQHQWNFDVLAIASACKVINPNFQYDLFLAACGALFKFNDAQAA
jgi:hypothetical protein